MFTNKADNVQRVSEQQKKQVNM